MTLRRSLIPAMGRLNWLRHCYEWIADFAVLRSKLHGDLAKAVFATIVDFTPKAGLRYPGQNSFGMDSGSKPVKILDVGCGNGDLLSLLISSVSQTQCKVIVAGIDADTLQIRKARQLHPTLAGAMLCAESFSLPFECDSFDIVTSTLMLHHLDDQQRVETFAEIKRVLVPGGQFMMVDCWKAKNAVMRLLGCIVGIADGFKRTRTNRINGLAELARDAGFSVVTVTRTYSTGCGTVAQCVCKTER